MRHGEESLILFICLVFLCLALIVESLGNCLLQFSFGYEGEPVGLTCEENE